jgi:hypothetical protein
MLVELAMTLVVVSLEALKKYGDCDQKQSLDESKICKEYGCEKQGTESRLW